MEQDIVNNLKSRVQKLEEELLRVVGIKLSQTIVLLAGILLYVVFFPYCVLNGNTLTHQVMYMYFALCLLKSGIKYPLDF